MKPNRQLIDRIHALEEELEQEFAARRRQFAYRLERGRVIFEESVRQNHQGFRRGLRDYLRHPKPLVVLTAPMIYGLIVPLVLLDLCVTIYQQVCFRVYRVPRVRRGAYIAIDRQHLGYLNGLEKLNCAYCGYATGLIAYVREIAARTEQFWCPIKHARRVEGIHSRYPGFAEYGDAAAYHQELEELRAALRTRRD